MLQNMDMIAFTIILVLFISLITNNSSCIPNDGEVNVNNSVSNNPSNNNSNTPSNNNSNTPSNNNSNTPSNNNSNTLSNNVVQNNNIQDYYDSNIQAYTESSDNYAVANITNDDNMVALKNKLDQSTSNYNPNDLLPQNLDDSFKSPFGVEELNTVLDVSLESDLYPTVTSVPIPNHDIRQIPPITKTIVSPWNNSSVEASDTFGFKVYS